MDFTTILSFTFIASLLVMSPGPNGVLIAKTVPGSGKAAGFANIAGFIAAFYLHGALSVFGISIILLQSAQAFMVVKLLGATYLCWIGFKALHEAWRGTARSNPVTAGEQSLSLRKDFMTGFVTNAFNPKVSMFYLAAFPQFIATGNGAISSALLLVVIHSLLNLVWFSAMVMLFARLANATRNNGFQRWLKGITGVVFIGFGVKLATLRP